MELSIEPEKKDCFGPLARQRTTSLCPPARVPMMPRFSKLGIIHSLSALSSHAVTSTEDSPWDVTSGTTMSAAMPDGWLF